MRPLRYSYNVPPSTGLAVGAGISQGLNNAVQNFARMRMQANQMAVQRMHMQAMQQNAQAMGIYRQAMAENLRQKSMGGTAADLQLLQAMAKGGKIPESVLRPAMKDRVETLLQTAKPEEKQALASHIEREIQGGQLPEEVAPYMNFNVNQMRAFGQMGKNVTAENVADTRAGATVDASQNRKEGQLGAAQIRANASSGGRPDVRADLQSMKDKAMEMRQISTSMSNLDKPPPMGALPLDDQTKSALKKQYSDQLTSLHSEYQQIHDRLSGGGQSQGYQAQPQNVQPQSQAQPQSPRILPWGQRDQRQPGDVVVNPNGVKLNVGQDKSFVHMGDANASIPVSTQPSSGFSPVPPGLSPPGAMPGLPPGGGMSLPPPPPPMMPPMSAPGGGDVSAPGS